MGSKAAIPIWRPAGRERARGARASQVGPGLRGAGPGCGPRAPASLDLGAPGEQKPRPGRRGVALPVSQGPGAQAIAPEVGGLAERRGEGFGRSLRPSLPLDSKNPHFLRAPPLAAGPERKARLGRCASVWA